MSTTTTTRIAAHPVAWFASRVHAVLDDLTAVAAWSMTPDEQRTTLVELSRAEARLVELRLRVLGAADTADIGAGVAASSTAAWVAHHTRQNRAAAHADLRLAKRLDGAYPITREALAGGRLNAEQARVIVGSVDALPDSATAEDRARAEAHLVGLAAEHDAKALKLLGRRVFEVIDPDAADEQLGRRLEAEEALAARRTSFRMWDNHNGTHSGRFTISDLHAAMLAKMLHAFTNPRHRHAHHGHNQHGHDPQPDQQPDQQSDAQPDQQSERPDRQPDRQPGHPGDRGRDPRCGQPESAPAADPQADPQTAPPADPQPNQAPGPGRDGVSKPPRRPSRPDLLGHAFCSLLERVPIRRLPTIGGVNASVVVLMDLQTLLTGSGAASLDTGEQISAGQARRLFCSAGVIPVVYARRLDGATMPLDVGRESRYHDRYQRIALTVRDSGCTTEHCDRPASWCHCHHQIPWSQGGGTSVEHGLMLCPFHHGRAHSPRYQITRLPDGPVRFHRRT